MTLLLNLYLGHLLGDFVFQPGWLVVAKRRGVKGLLIHTGIIGACTAIILIGEIAAVWNIILLAMAAHAGIELITIRMRTFRHMSGLSVFLIDQAMHIVSLVVLVYVATPWIDVEEVTTFGQVVDPAVVAFACALIGVSFMGSIIVFEVSNTVGPDTWNREILPYDRARITGMVERGAALVLGVAVPALGGALGPVLMVLPFIPRIVYATRQEGEERARQMVIAATGLIICVFGWSFVIFTAALARGGY
jgi:hypothetical protein